MANPVLVHIVRKDNRLLVGGDAGDVMPAALPSSLRRLLAKELTYVELKFLKGRELFEAKKLGLPHVQSIAWECFGLDLRERLCTSFGFKQRVCRALASAGVAVRLTSLSAPPLPEVFEPRWDRIYDGETVFRHKQEEMLLKIFANENGRFSCPPGWGKSHIIGLVAKGLPKAKVAVVTRSVPVLTTRIYPELCGMVPNVGIVGGGHNRRGCRVMCYTAASLHHCPEDVDIMLVDECFPAGTPVDGRPIEELQCGDTVTTFNHRTSATEHKTILRTFRRQARRLVRVTLADGSVLCCTPEHPIYSPEPAAYVPACALAKHSSVFGDNLRRLVVVSVEMLQQGRDAEFDQVCPGGAIFNLEVADNNNYFANGVLVHNCHQAASDDAAYKLGKFRRARMFGLSATHDMRLDNKDMRCEAIFGPMRMVVTYQECVDANIIVPIEICWANVVMDEDPCAGLEDVNKKRAGIWRNDYRNSVIAADARRYPDTQVLITCEVIEHVLALKRVLPEGVIVYHEGGMDAASLRSFEQHDLIPADFKVMTQELKERRIARLTSGRPGIYIASPVLNIGVDCRYLPVLCRADAGGSPINDTQIPGRTSRINDRGKLVGRVHDYLDQFNMGFRQRAARRYHNYAANGWSNILPDKRANSWLAAKMDWD